MAEEKPDTTAYDLLENLDYSMKAQESDIRRLMELQDSYDNKINPKVWPTQSEIPTAQHFIAVEEALGPAMDMCFPETNGLQLLPTSADVTEDQWRNAEWALWTTLQYKMRLASASLRSVKDCFKCGIGYGIVEPFSITPDISTRLQIGSKETRIMAPGRSVTSIRYRYVSPGKCVPYPAGTSFNGPEATPMAFFYDPTPAWQVKKLLEGDEGSGIDPKELHASWAEVEKLSKEFAKHQITDLVSFYEKMGGRRAYRSKKSAPESAPQEVPIIKVYEQPGTETWIVPKNNREGVVLLRRVSDALTQVRCGLVKWSAWPDGDRWYPMSAPEADMRRCFAQDLWLNFMFDLMGKSKDAPRVINKSALGPEQRHLYPNEDIYVENADARTAASYLEPPRMDPSIPMVGDVLEKLGDKINGRRDFMQKNFTRGGTQAFNDLLNTMQGRQRLSATILETGALTDIYEHVLAHLRTTVPEQAEGGLVMQRPVYDADKGRTIAERRTITAEDMRNSFELIVDTSERRMLGGMPDELRFRIWQTLVDRDDVRRHEVNRLCPLPEATIRRVFLEREDLDRLQQENRDSKILSQLTGVAQREMAGQASAAGPAA
jgi:hypothetical protein